MPISIALTLDREVSPMPRSCYTSRTVIIQFRPSRIEVHEFRDLAFQHQKDSKALEHIA
ncbi:hypothetical protein FOXYSP1_07521 [Fusarium oxysporum f. sp. phaseoli]